VGCTASRSRVGKINIRFYAIAAVPRKSEGVYKSDPISTAAVQLLKFLFFRVMFLSGYGKLISHCPAWRDLSAMRIHFQSQPIPHIGGYFAHIFLSDFTKELISAATIYMEIVLPLLIYIPVQYFQIWSFILQASIMKGIMATGNFNFFNVLSVGIGLCSIDDEALHRFYPKFMLGLLGVFGRITDSEKIAGEEHAGLAPRKGSSLTLGLFSSQLWDMLAFWIGNAYLFYTIFFKASSATLEWNLSFPDYFLKVNTPENLSYLIILIFTLGFVAIIRSFARAALPTIKERPHSLENYLYLGGGLVLFIFVFGVSIPNFVGGMGQSMDKLPILRENANLFKEIGAAGRLYNVGNGYGLFRSMTGLQGTPVIVFEGLLSSKSTPSVPPAWYELEIEGKLGDTHSMPSVYIPCQKRIPWQLWFSALEQNPLQPHFISLLYRILNNSEDYNGLIRVGKPVGEGAAMTLPLSSLTVHSLRIKHYLYRMTDGRYSDDDAYWNREIDPTHGQTIELNKQNIEQIKQFLKSNGIVGDESIEERTEHPLARLLDWIAFC